MAEIIPQKLYHLPKISFSIQSNIMMYSPRFKIFFVILSIVAGVAIILFSLLPLLTAIQQ